MGLLYPLQFRYYNLTSVEEVQLLTVEEVSVGSFLNQLSSYLLFVRKFLRVTVNTLLEYILDLYFSTYMI